MTLEIIQKLTGDICEPCYALNSGIDPSYWEGDAEGFAHAERHALEWAELGVMVLDTGENPVAHFGKACIVCGTPPCAGTVYTGTLTVFKGA